MICEKVKIKKTSDAQTLDLNERSEDEDMELYQKNEEPQTLELLQDIEDFPTNDSTALEDFSQQYDMEDETLQCVPQLSMESPLQNAKTKQQQAKRPRTKITAQRKRMEKSSHKSNLNIQTVLPKRVPLAKIISFQEDDFPKARKEGTWIQCSRIDCLKWRKLPNETEPFLLPDRWVCAMNPDTTRKQCTASQETCDSQDDFDVVYTPFVQGSLVWAKVQGYPWWPGIVEDDPDYKCCYETDDSDVNPISYHVSFTFDKDVSRSWVSNFNVCSFHGVENINKMSTKQKRFNKPLERALIKARKAMDMSLAERLRQYSFNLLYKGYHGERFN
ncbi:zinc finger CW-type PWWP domain protein 1-like [Xenia sp. Carnegie-2017]|uniref:zinc finger CW-type PWWP domain protein 1-like n=1 Tax=Xenia sp. Carnegie-2017 TaxID=2897299 RepID=UPI001F03EC0D|nr:zinc finger CW-type PWWP domain protein 1-like [Xenia sp. Carnegie-2017]